MKTENEIIQNHRKEWDKNEENKWKTNMPDIKTKVPIITLNIHGIPNTVMV